MYEAEDAVVITWPWLDDHESQWEPITTRIVEYSLDGNNCSERIRTSVGKGRTRRRTMGKELPENVVAAEHVNLVREEILVHRGVKDRLSSCNSRVVDLQRYESGGIETRF